MRRIKALVLVLGVCLAGFTCCLLGVMVRQAKELWVQARLSVGTDLLEQLTITDRSGAPIYDGGYNEEELTRRSTFHIIGDLYGSLPNAVLTRQQTEATTPSFLTGFRSEPQTIQLTLDLRLQNAAYSLLQDGGYRGAVVVLDYTTGDVLVMTSTPSVDAENPDNYEDGAFLCKALLTYAPGSTMKAVTAAAGLEKDTAAAEAFAYTCGGFDDYARCADTTAHGAQHLRDILIHSCNCGIGAFARTLLAPEELNEFALSAHLLASDIPSDFPGQASGTLDAEDDLTWSAIGQSTDLLTPISLCAFYAAIANQGVWIAPHLLTETEPVGECIIARSTAQYLVDAMTPVAANAGIACSAFGKTGTAELDDAPPHGWFIISLTDEQAPPYTIAVFLENCGGASYAKTLVATFTNHYLLGGDVS